MVSDEFWERCVNASCYIAPVRAYSKLGDGCVKLLDEDCIGARFAAVPCPCEAVGPDFWFMIDEQISGADSLHETPEAALSAYEARSKS